MGEVSDTKTLQEVRRPNGISTETCPVRLRKTSGSGVRAKRLKVFLLISVLDVPALAAARSLACSVGPVVLAVGESVSVPVGLSVSECELGTSALSSCPTAARASHFYQARGEDSLGLRGFSGVCVSLRAL